MFHCVECRPFEVSSYRRDEGMTPEEHWHSSHDRTLLPEDMFEREVNKSHTSLRRLFNKIMSCMGYTTNLSKAHVEMSKQDNCTCEEAGWAAHQDCLGAF